MRLVEPYGFMKVSALGVEEQRVNVIIDFVNRAEEWSPLDHGFRVEVAVITWEDDDVVQARSPLSFATVTAGPYSASLTGAPRSRRSMSAGTTVKASRSFPGSRPGSLSFCIRERPSPTALESWSAEFRSPALESLGRCISLHDTSHSFRNEKKCSSARSATRLVASLIPDRPVTKQPANNYRALRGCVEVSLDCSATRIVDRGKLRRSFDPLSH